MKRRLDEFVAMSPSARRAALAGEDRQAWLEAGAKQGFVEAQTLLGQTLLDAGRAEEALAWFRIAAGAGHEDALNMVGRCHERGWGTPPDPALAALHYERAAERGSVWALFNLAGLHLYGQGVARDRLQAFALYEAAARRGHAKAANMIARFYDEGWDRPADLAEAARWYRRAAEGGDFRGQYNFATLLAASGQRTEALRWLERALAAGSPDFVEEAGASLRRHPDPAFRALGERSRPSPAASSRA